jgi:hypothetical protein
MVGFLMGNLFGTSRLVFALGRDGYLPRRFASVSATRRVPLWALSAHALLACTLAIVGNFEALALVSGGAICLVYALVSLAAWRAQSRDLRERGDRPFRPASAPCAASRCSPRRTISRRRHIGLARSTMERRSAARVGRAAALLRLQAEVHAHPPLLRPAVPGACGDFNFASAPRPPTCAGAWRCSPAARVKIGYQAGLKLLRAGAR